MRRHARYIVLTTTILATVLNPVMAFADPSTGRTDGWHMGWGMGEGWGFGHGLFGAFWMVLFWGGIIALIVYAIRGFRGPTHRNAPPASDKTPIDILRERYARGEIDKAEFDKRKKHLSQ